MTTLRPHELQALEFLHLGADCIGIIETDEQMAAALVFADLAKRGFVEIEKTADGPVFSITSRGIAAMESAHDGR